MKKYIIKAIRIFQKEDRSKGQALFTGKIQVKDLINEDDYSEERFVIDSWSSKKTQEPGYQRLPNPNNIEKIKKYILEETQNPLLPTSIVVNSREPLTFKEDDDSYGELEISNVLYVIDGQHRVEAFKELMKEPKLRNLFGNYEIPFMILSNFEYIKELEQFFIINSRQTKIKFDLAQRMYMEMMKDNPSTHLVPESKRWQTLAGKAADILNDDSKSVWYGKIQLPDDSKDIRKTRIISQNSFITSLKPFFTGGKRIWNFNAIPERRRYEVLEQIIELLTKFWNMAKEVYPNVFHNPKKYTLLKSIGVYTMHIFLSMVIMDSQVFNIDQIIENAKKKLIYARDRDHGFTEVFWEVGSKNDTRKRASGYSSSAGHNKMAAAINSGNSTALI